MEKVLIAQLMEMPPRQWARAIQKHQVFTEYCAIDRPHAADVERCGGKLGLKRRGFYRLLRIFKDGRADIDQSPVRKRAGGMLGVEVERLIAATICRLGPVARLSDVVAEIERLCLSEQLPVPSVSAIRARLGRTPKASKLQARIPVLNDWLLDSCVLRLSVQSPSGPASAAKLVAIFDVRTGCVIAHRLIAAGLQRAEIVPLLMEARQCEPRSLNVRTVGVTQHIFQGSPPADNPGSPFLLCGLEGRHSGLGFSSVFGNKIGTVKWHASALPSIALDAPVTIPEAQAVLSALIDQRNTQLMPAPDSVQPAASP